MDSLPELLNTLNIPQLFAIGVMFWFFYSRLDTKIEKLEEKFESRFDRIEDKVDRLETRVNDIDKRLFGIETMLHMKDCCALKDNTPIKKAE